MRDLSAGAAAQLERTLRCRHGRRRVHHLHSASVAQEGIRLVPRFRVGSRLGRVCGAGDAHRDQGVQELQGDGINNWKFNPYHLNYEDMSADTDYNIPAH